MNQQVRTLNTPGLQWWGAIALFAAMLALSGCSREAAPPAASTSATAPPASVPARTAQVLIAAPRPDGAEWLLVDPNSGEARSLGTSPPRAELLALDDSAGDFYYRTGDVLWRDNWRAIERAAVRVAAAPPVTGTLHALWVDAGDGRLRALEMREPTAFEVKGMRAEPPDARPYWALLWVYRDGEWTLQERRPTSWAADGTVGPAVFDDLHKERGRSARSIDDASSCVRLCDESTELPPGVDPGQAEEWRALTYHGGRMVFGVLLGDTWHPVGPVVSQGRMVAPGAGESLRLQLRDDRLLVAPAALPTVAVVIELATGSRRELPTSATPPAWVD